MVTPPRNDASSGAFDALLAILRHKLVMFVSIGGGLAGGYVVTQEQTPVYESRAQVLIINHDHGDQVVEAVNARRGFEDSAVSQAIIAQSERILGKAVETLSAAVDQGDLPDLAFLRRHPAPALWIGSQLAVSPARLDDRSVADDILDFRYHSPSAAECPTVLSAVIAAYQSFLDEARAGSTREVISIITDARDVVERRLTALQEEYREFRRQSPLVWEDGKARNAHEERMAAAEQQLTRLRLRRVEREAELKRIDEAMQHGVGNEVLLLALEQMVDEPGPARTTEQVEAKTRVSLSVFDMLTEYDEMKEIYGPDHPKLRSLAAKIERARRYFPEFFREQNRNRTPTEYLVSVFRQSLAEELKTLAEKEDQLSRYYEEENRLARQMLESELRSEELLDQIERSKTLFDSLVNRLEQLDAIPEAGGISAATLLQPTAPYQIKPVLRLNVFLGGVAGMLLGAVLSFLLEAAKDEYVSVDDVEQQLDAPVLGLLPARRANQVWISMQKSGLSRELWMLHAPGDVLSDAVRRISSALAVRRNGPNGQSLLITSADVEDGKTMISANVAIALAKARKRVILIDCDLHRRRIARLFELDNEAGGVTSILTEEADIPDVIQPCEAVPGLDLLPAGPRVDSSSELLASSAFPRLIEWLRERYDHLVLDSPPVFAVSDATSIAPHVDDVLYVLQLSDDARATSARACKILREAGARIVGVAINRVDGRRTRFRTVAYETDYYATYGYHRSRKYADDTVSADDCNPSGSPTS